MGATACIRAGLGLGCLVVATPCRATPLSLTIATERTATAADCADDAKLLAKVEQIAQRPLAPRTTTADAVRVLIRFDRSQAEYRAELAFHGAKPGERSLRDRSHDCEPLEDAVAVAIALLLDREVERRERESTRAASAATTIKIIHAEVAPKQRPHATVYTVLEPGAQAGFGARANASVALDLGFTPLPGWLLESSAWATRPTTHAYATGKVTVSLLAGALRACRLWGSGWQWGPCAAVAVGRLHGSGWGFDESMSANLLWSAVGGSMLVLRSLNESWDLGLHASAWVPLQQQRFSVQNAGTAWTSEAAVLGLSVRLGFRFR